MLGAAGPEGAGALRAPGSAADSLREGAGVPGWMRAGAEPVSAAAGQQARVRRPGAAVRLYVYIIL